MKLVVHSFPEVLKLCVTLLMFIVTAIITCTHSYQTRVQGGKAPPPLRN